MQVQTASVVRLDCGEVMANLAKHRLLARPDVYLKELGDFSMEEDGCTYRIHNAEGDPVIPSPKIG